MEFVYYTIAAIILYTVSDFILNIIIMALSTASFNLLQAILVPLDSEQKTTKTQTEQIMNKQSANK